MNRLNKRFVLKHEIGAGGMARVYLGCDEVLDRFVAVKILNPIHGGTDVGARFRREGRTAARLSHPNVVPVYGAGEGEFEGREVSYIVMEYVAGGDLKALIDEQGPLPNTRLALLGSEVSLGLAHAHAKGVIHRDIKPHNVLIDSYGRPKLADFGIARALDATHATQTGSYLGTALYSSPEQLQGEKITPKSDVYSLGAAFYQIATGEVPFTGTPIEVASQHIIKTPPEPRALGASLSDEAEALILDCLQKNPDHRPIAEEVHERLLAAAEASHSNSVKKSSPLSVGNPAKIGHTRSYSSEASTAKPPLSGAWREGKERRRRRGWAILAAAALLLILVGVAVYAAVLGGEDTEMAQAPPEESQQEAIVPEDKAAQPEGSEEEVSAEAVQEDTSETDQDSPEQDPARVVEEFYQTAVDRDFGRHSRTMTPEWRQANFPSQGEFENTYFTLQDLEFAVGPTTIGTSGDTATVTGETIARHTNRTERNAGTWTLVYQNGEWRISEWNVGNISTEYL